MTTNFNIPLEQSNLEPKSLPSEVKITSNNGIDNSKFTDSPVFRQSSFWSHAILWGLISVSAFALLWANFAKIEEAVPAQGKLEPQGTVKEVQSPIAGVVNSVYVKEGQKVRKGDLLLRLDATAAQAQLGSLSKVRYSLKQENQFYRAQLLGKSSIPASALITAQIQLPPQLASLTQSRAALIAENNLYRVQLSGAKSNPNLTPEQEARLEFSQAELNSRIATAELETQQLEKQLRENQAQLSSAKDIRGVNETILGNIEPLVKEGAISRLQFLRQQQEVRTRRGEMERLTEEQARLRDAIAQSKQKLRTTIATAKKELLVKISDNDTKIAEINSQLNKAILENEKRIAEIDGQISQTQLNLKYQELRAPSDGIIFDLQARYSGFVTNPSQPVLKIVPDEPLTAKVYITNQDIGFVKQGMKVDVRIDSFPSSEFGDIKGEIVWVGSDALPPDQIRPYYSFPAKIRLDNQSLKAQGRDLPLQSGMSISTSIKLRQRTVMSIFTEQFSKNVDAIKNMR